MPAGEGVDPRGPRFAAAVTTAVLATILITGWWPLLAAQTVVFGIGAFVGVRFVPYSVLYRLLVAPPLSTTQEHEDPRPLRFAQAVGFAFALIGTLGYATGIVVLGAVATALALVAALLNAAFDVCLGCEAYLLLRRLAPSRTQETDSENTEKKVSITR